jgi:thiamine pyrophosphate-dependent acetolactate synthase large subunit-like protein
MVNPTPLDRRAAVAALLRDRGDLLVVAGLGSPAYDLHAAGDHDANFYLWGAMGGAALMGLGLAQARPERSVLVLTGDGEALMGLGGLATIVVAAPGNLTIAPGARCGVPQEPLPGVSRAGCELTPQSRWHPGAKGALQGAP